MLPKLFDTVDVMTKDNIDEIFKHMTTGNRMFLNSECIFVEYHDILKCPWYILLTVLQQNNKVQPILDLTKIEYFNTDALFEWYCNRENRNFLYDLLKPEASNLDMDKLLDTLMDNEIFYTIDMPLNATAAIQKVLKNKLVKKIVVYSESYSKYIEEDVKKLFSNSGNVKYRTGDLKKILKDDVPTDTTYFLSDFNKVITLADCDHLSYGSLVLPFDFEYNYCKNDKGERTPIIDFTYLGKDHLFKLAYFNSCYK